MKNLTVFVLLALLAALTAPGGTAPRPASAPVPPPVFTNPLVFTNPFHPFVPGGMKVYTGKENGTRVVTVDLFRADTRVFRWNGADVETAIIQETEFEDGELVEISQNYFAQADDRTVYYFGETVDDYEDGVVVGHGGSWLVGGPTLPGDPVETAVAMDPAVYMPGNPEVGDVWKPEDLPPLVDETFRAVSLDATAKTAAGRFRRCLKVKESSDIDPGHHETKWYAGGQGVVMGKDRGEHFQLAATTF